MSETVLVTGATGFHGSHVLRELAAQGWAKTVGLVRSSPASRGPWRLGDLTDPASLRKAVRDVDVIVHCGGYVGYDPELCNRVNVGGTRALVEASRDAGGARIVYVSTCGVYGRGPHRGESVEQLIPAPHSALSESRLRAERLVLDAGGIVVRPHLVYGAGDTRFIPTLVRVQSVIGGLPEGGRSLVSTIHVRELARILASIARTPPIGERILHAAHPDPTRMLDVVHAVRSPDFAPIREIGTPAAREALIAAGLSPTPIDMLAVDDWFEGAATWNEMGLRPGAPFHLDPADRRWYASITL